MTFRPLRLVCQAHVVVDYVTLDPYGSGTNQKWVWTPASMPRIAAPARGFAFGDARAPCAEADAPRRNSFCKAHADHRFGAPAVLPRRDGTAREDLALRPILRGRAGPPDRFEASKTCNRRRPDGRHGAAQRRRSEQPMWEALNAELRRLMSV